MTPRAVRLSRRSLLELAAATACFGCSRPPGAGSPSASTPTPASAAPGADASAPPPKPGTALLLPGALITGAALHASGRLLATSSTVPRGESPGQVVVWDVERATAVHVYQAEHGAGWTWSPDLLMWAPSGNRLAAAVSTNGIVVLEQGKAVGSVFLDETRDHPVRFCWVEDDRQIYGSSWGPDGSKSTGAIAPVRSEAVWAKDARWLPAGVPGKPLARMRWNATIGAIVGDDFAQMSAIDPKKGALRYEVSLSVAHPKPTIGSVPPAWSSDGRRLAVAGPGGVTLFDGDTGSTLARIPIDGHIDDLSWGTQHRLAVVTGPTFKTPSTVLVVIDGRVERSIDAPIARLSLELPDPKPCVWSPAGDALALLLRDGSVRIVEVSNGRPRRTIRASVPSGNAAPRAGLFWATPHRLVVASPEGLAFLWLADASIKGAR
ncbi:MAG: hypothetical protein HYZ29_22240 [Myxococcales bacterium]|nr:hypothetical protein [Myxococcales bacterium]